MTMPEVRSTAEAASAQLDDRVSHYSDDFSEIRDHIDDE